MDSLLASSDGTAFSEEQSSKAVGGRGWLLAPLHTARRCYSYGKGAGKKNEGGGFTRRQPPPSSLLSLSLGWEDDRRRFRRLGCCLPIPVYMPAREWNRRRWGFLPGPDAARYPL